jgi:tetratricopeptide (TPR) repeat protein
MDSVLRQITILLFLAASLSAALRGSDPVKIIVFPLENLAAPSLSWIGEGTAISLSEELGIPGVEVIERDARISFVEDADLPPLVPLSRASMIRVGQLASADLAVMGTCSGSADKLKLALNVLNLRTMKLGGQIAANGPLSVLPDMENELAWNLLSNAGLSDHYSRSEFQSRTRRIPNAAYATYVQALDAEDEGAQIALLEKAVREFPDFPDAQFRLGRLFYRKEECREAVRHLELGRRKDESYVRGDFMLGTCYLESNALSDALRTYSALLSFARPVEALNNRSIANIRKGDYTLALQDLLEAHKVAPNNATVTLNLALLRHLQGNEAAALTTLEEALKINAGNGMLQFLDGIVLKATGDSEGAADAFARARSLGVDVDKTLSEDPKAWLRIFLKWGT